MSLFAKIMVVVNLVLAVAFLAAAGTLLGATENYKQRYEGEVTDRAREVKALEDQLTSARNQIETLREQAASAEQRAASVEGQLKTLSESNTTVHARNQELQQSLDRLSQTYASMEEQNRQLQAQVGTMQGEVATAQAERRQALQEQQNLQETVARLEQAQRQSEESLAAQESSNRELSEQIDQLTTELDIRRKTGGPIVSTVMKNVDARVQAADNRVNVYVLSVGRNEGVEVGYEFTVYRDGQYVATVVVDEVFDRYATARVKPGTKRLDIRAGDQASTQL